MKSAKEVRDSMGTLEELASRLRLAQEVKVKIFLKYLQEDIDRKAKEDKFHHAFVVERDIWADVKQVIVDKGYKFDSEILSMPGLFSVTISW